MSGKRGEPGHNHSWRGSWPRLGRLHDTLLYLCRCLMRARPPAVLYRYRGTSYVLDGCLEDLLVRDRIRVSSPARFNDPFDCRARLSFTGSAKDRRQFLAKQLAKHFGSSPSASELKEAERTLRDPDDILAGFQVSIDNSAVLCLCDTATNPLLWAHYSGGHHGICLGFDTSAPPISKAVRVHYQKAYPKANVMTDRTIEQIKACIFTKAAWWKYEREWRVFTYKQPEGYWPIEADALKSVILGMKVEQHVADQVCRLCHTHKPHQVQVLQAKAGPDTFDLQIIPLP